MPENERQAATRVSMVVGLGFGIIIGTALAMVVVSFLSPTDNGLSDIDGDGVPDSHDLQKDGNARIRITASLLEHPQLSQDVEVTLNITYDGNGDPSGDHDAQTCSLSFTIVANSSSTTPAVGCTLDSSDWSILAVGFGYSLTHLEETVADGLYTHHWDLFPGSGADTAGYNSSVDAWMLHEGSTAILDGLSDGDDNEWNARLYLVFAADDE